MSGFEAPLAAIGGGLVSSLIGGRSAPEAPEMPPPPKPEEMLDVIDEITGTQAITTKGPDGKKRRVISRLPRTKQEQALFNQADQMMGQALQNLSHLYQRAPEYAVDFRPLIDTMGSIQEDRLQDLAHVFQMEDLSDHVNHIKALHREILDHDLEEARILQEEKLLQRGHDHSTGGNSLRAHLEKEGAIAKAQSDLMSDKYGEDLRQARLKEKMMQYGLKEDARKQEEQRAQQTYALQKEQMADLDRQHQQMIQQNQAQVELGSQLKGQDLKTALQSKAGDMALNDYMLRNKTQMDNYNANINRIQSDYQNRLAKHQASPPSFGELAGSMLTTLGGSMLTAPADSMMGKWMNKGNDTGSSLNISPMSFKDFSKSIQYPGSNRLKMIASNLKPI